VKAIMPSIKYEELSEHIDDVNEMAEKLITERPSAILDESMMVPD
jgi:hypothetical protein